MCGPPRTAKTVPHLFSIDGMALSIRFCKMFLSLGSAISLVTLHCVVRGCPTHARPDLSKKSILAIPCVVLFPFQSCSLQVELYKICHYHALKENNGQWLKLEAWDLSIWSAKLWTAVVLFRLVYRYVRPPLPITPYATKPLWSFIYERGVILYAHFLSYQNTSGIILQTESDLVRENHLTTSRCVQSLCFAAFLL